MQHEYFQLTVWKLFFSTPVATRNPVSVTNKYKWFKGVFLGDLLLQECLTPSLLACVRREVRWSFWVLRVIDICLTWAAVIATTWLHNSIHRNTSLATCLTPRLWDRHYFGNVVNVCCSWTFRRSSAPNRHCSASCSLPPQILHCADWVVGQSWFAQGNIMCFLYFFSNGKIQIYLEVFSQKNPAKP